MGTSDYRVKLFSCYNVELMIRFVLQRLGGVKTRSSTIKRQDWNLYEACVLYKLYNFTAYFMVLLLVANVRTATFFCQNNNGLSCNVPISIVTKQFTSPKILRHRQVASLRLLDK